MTRRRESLICAGFSLLYEEMINEEPPGKPEILSASTHLLALSKLQGLECAMDLKRRLQVNVRYASDTQRIPGLLICAVREQTRLVVDFIWDDALLLANSCFRVRNSVGQVFESSGVMIMNGGNARARVEFSVGEDTELDGATLSIPS